MKKLLYLALFAILLIPSNVSAEIRQTENGTVTAMESAFTYQQPILSDGSLGSITSIAALPGGESNEKLKLENIFSVYVKSTRFYNRSKAHFRALKELDITSHTEKIDLLFDDSLPPRIEYEKNGRQQTLPLKRITYDNQYFISFKLRESDLNELYDADKVEIVFPTITSGSNIVYKKNKKSKKGKAKPVYAKKELKKDSTVAEVRYTVPPQIIKEWQQVMAADIDPGSIADTLQ